jgi:hypothetical protein
VLFLVKKMPHFRNHWNSLSTHVRYQYESGCVSNGKYSGINFRTLQFHTGKAMHTTVKQPDRQGSHSTQNSSKF